MTRKSLAAALALGLSAFAPQAHAQSAPSNPAMTYGMVPTVGMWNSWFQQKQDALGFIPLNQGGGTMLGPLVTMSSSTIAAGLNIGPGVALASPNAGDVWVTMSGLYVRVGSTTVGPLASTGSNVFTTTQTINLNAAAAPAPDLGTLLHVLSAEGTTSRIEATAAAASATFTGRRADGALASPTALVNADLVAAFNAHGYDGAAWSGVAGSYRLYAEGAWSNVCHPTEACLSTTPSGSITIADVFCVHQDGGAAIASAADAGAGTLNVPTSGYYINGAPSIGNIATLSANSLLANWTGTSAAPVSNAVPSCLDSAGNHLNFGSGSGITCGSTSSTAASVPTPQGRLTLTSGTPVLTSAVSAAATVYFSPYLGQSAPLWNGSAFIPTAYPEISNVLANSAVGSAGPAAAIASSVYDLFVGNNGGTCTLTRGPAWTNTTTRSAGTALGRVNGFLTNSVAITNGPGAGFGTYVGTIATDGAGAMVTFSLGSSATGGGAAVIGLWNQFNRRAAAILVIDTGAPYIYSSAATRPSRASTTFRVTFIVGQVEDAISAGYNVSLSPAATVDARGQKGLALNGTTSYGVNSVGCQNWATNFAGCTLSMSATYSPQLGQNFVQALESGDNTTTTTFDSGSSAALQASIPF